MPFQHGVTLAAQQQLAQLGPAMPTSENPFNAYRGNSVPPPDMTNSLRLRTLIRNGRLYLSLRDAIDLALEDNLDLVIARYNLPIAQTDILRTQAGGSVRGVNTAIVSGTPGGSGNSFGAGSGAGGTSTGAGGAGSGASGIVQSTYGVGTSVSGFDPEIQAKIYDDHASEQLTNRTVYKVSDYRLNTNLADMSYSQSFPTGTYLEADWNNSRETSNSPSNELNPLLSTSAEIFLSQQLLAGFGTGPNLRYLRIAKANQEISDIALRAQVIATVAQICNIYWDLVNAFNAEQFRERSVAFATETLETTRKQLALQAIPALDVLRAESDLAQRQQDLTVARTNLELQELYMKNAITRSLDIEEIRVVPTDRLPTKTATDAEPIEQSIAEALRNRPELQESALDLENRSLSRKSAQNALLPQLELYGYYVGSGTGGVPNSAFIAGGGTVSAPRDYGGVLLDALNNSSPEYQVGLQLSLPLRNRVAKADQYRTELEFRQAQVYTEEQKKNIAIEVRNSRYAVEQNASRIEAARKGFEIAQRKLEIVRQERQLGVESTDHLLAAEHDLAVAESSLVDAQTAYEKTRVQLKRAAGSLLTDYGISISAAKTGRVEAGRN